MPTPENLASVLWEVALEAARISIDPLLPSRLNCVFATESLEFAQHFRDKYRAGGIIFETELVGSPAVFLGDFALLSESAPSTPYANYISSRSKQYWTTAPSREPELVVAGSLRVISALAL